MDTNPTPRADGWTISEAGVRMCPGCSTGDHQAEEWSAPDCAVPGCDCCCAGSRTTGHMILATISSPCPAALAAPSVPLIPVQEAPAA